MTDELTRSIQDERAAKNAHWAAHPLPHPTYDGRPLQIGDEVRTTPGHYVKTGVVTEISVRCYGLDRTEQEYDFSAGIGPNKRKLIGERPMQQIWIELNGDSNVFRPEDIAEVLNAQPA